MQKVSKGFYVGCWLIGNLGYWLISAAVAVLIAVYPETRVVVSMLMMPASMLSILAGVVCLILIYKMWAAIQGMGARTSPGKALGFMFIPLFNLYWAFVVYWGWTRDYNKIGEREGVELPQMPEGIALTACILPLLSFAVVPAMYIRNWPQIRQGIVSYGWMWPSMVIYLATVLFMAVLFSKICDGLNALVAAGLEPQRPQYAVPPEEAKLSGLAVASLILGITGFCTAGLTAIIGLILGIIGIVRINRSYGQLKGKGLAIAGTAVSGVACVFVPIMVAIMMPALFRARGLAQTTVFRANAQQLSLVFSMYCGDHDGKFPPSANWPDAVSEYTYGQRAMLTWPNEPDTGRCWAMNAGLDNLNTHQIRQPARTVMFFECRTGGPCGGGRELLPDKPRYNRGYLVGFVDGHVEFVRPGRVDELIWEPVAD